MKGPTKDFDPFSNDFVVNRIISRWDPSCQTLKIIASCNDIRMKAGRCVADVWGYSWCRSKWCAEHWRESGVVKTGAKQTRVRCEISIELSLCVTYSNPSLTNDRSMLPLSSGCNPHVQKRILPIIALYALLQIRQTSQLYTTNIIFIQWLDKRLRTGTIWSVHYIAKEWLTLATRILPFKQKIATMSTDSWVGLA